MEINLIVYYKTWEDVGTWLIESVKLGTISTPFSGNMTYFEVKERIEKYYPGCNFTNFS